MRNKIEEKISKFINESNTADRVVDMIRKILVDKLDLYEEDEYHVDVKGKNVVITFDSLLAIPRAFRMLKTVYPAAIKSGGDKIVIPNVIKETEVSNLVAPELNVDRDRKKWLRKQGKDAEGLPESRSMQAAGVMEADEKVTCPKCKGTKKIEGGKDCYVCRGSGQLSRKTWEKQYGNPKTVKEAAQVQNLGYANGWAKTPPQVEKCRKLKHKPNWEKIGGSDSHHQVTCNKCGYTYKVDSGD